MNQRAQQPSPSSSSSSSSSLMGASATRKRARVALAFERVTANDASPPPIASHVDGRSRNRTETAYDALARALARDRRARASPRSTIDVERERALARVRPRRRVDARAFEDEKLERDERRARTSMEREREGRVDAGETTRATRDARARASEDEHKTESERDEASASEGDEASASEGEDDDGAIDVDGGGESAETLRAKRGEALDERASRALHTQRVRWLPLDGDATYERACGTAVVAMASAPRLTGEKARARWERATGASGFASARQAEFYSMIASYADVQNGDRKVVSDERAAGQQANDEILDATLAHVVEHVTRTRNRVMKNNEALAKKAKAGKRVMEDDLPRDQGFVRPTVLFLTPMRNMAGRAIMRLLDLCPAAHGRNDSVNKLERIEEDFLAYRGSDSDEDDDGGREKKKKYKGHVPDDHKALFKGNTDDHFRLGMKITKASVRLYVDFFGADIIFASPLGLVTALQDEKSAADFLSSIEILVVDHAHVMQMQNWAHVLTITDAMNALPKEMRDCDIQRVYESHLNGFAKHLRQTILLSAFQTPEQNSFFNRRCVNVEGKLRLKTAYKGVLGQLTIKTRQQFERVHMSAADVVNADDIRFKYFVKHTLPRIRENPEPGVVIFISSYFDFVRVRNLLTKEEVSFAVNSEYTEPSEAARARTLFADGRKRVLLLTERAHFYFRRRIKGAREICFYSLPEHAIFYPELVSYLAGSRAAEAVDASAVQLAHVAGVSALFSKLDALKLERIVGTARASKMIANAEHPMFLFV